MKPLLLAFGLLGTLALASAQAASSSPRNYVFFNLDRAGLHQEWFSHSKVFVGAQVKYTWKSLEPSEGTYDFSAIDEDLGALTGMGKGLFLQIQDVSFSEDIVNVPSYLRTGPGYHGGADRQYEFANDQDAKPIKGGWVARRWDPAVADRFARLLGALGARFDGRVAGITLPETSVDFGSTGRYWPSGFTPKGYAAAFKTQMAVAKAAFPRSEVLQYTNFLPGEWLPWSDQGYQSSLWAFAADQGIAMGGPDLIPYKKAQMSHSLHFAQQYRGRVRLGYAVQEGNLTQINAKTGKRMTVADVWTFATEVLGVDELFWFPQEPQFTRDVVPFLTKILTRSGS